MNKTVHLGWTRDSVEWLWREVDKEVRKYHQRALEDHYRYLTLDGVVLKAKGPGGPGERG